MFPEKCHICEQFMQNCGLCLTQVLELLLTFLPKLRPCIPLFLFFIFVLGSAFFSIVAAGDLDLGVQ